MPIPTERTVWPTAANVHDSEVFGGLIEAVEPIRSPGGRDRPRCHLSKPHGDTACDIPRCRADLRRRGFGSRFARQGVESGERLGRYRCFVERAPAWLTAFGG